ncbi:MAG TPA: hypothetical protein ENH82_13295 [bacterium]|nr:hypothetical protein [bacterium]
MNKKNLTIKNLTANLPERGKIKIGKKGELKTSKSGNEFRLPQKLDHFLITTMERGNDDNFLIDKHIHDTLLADKKYSPDGKTITRIPILLLFNNIELNFQTQYSCFSGKTMVCSGDGETALRLNKKDGRDEIECPCNRLDPEYKGTPNDPKCKINGVLSVFISCTKNVGGAWKFRTTSFNTVVGITSTLAFFQRISGGHLAGIPFNMVINPKTVITPGTQKTQTIFVVGIEYDGSITDLQQKSLQIAGSQAEFKVQIEGIETEARKQIAAASEISDDEIDDYVDEFNPDEAIEELKKDGKKVDVSTGEITDDGTGKALPEIEDTEKEIPALKAPGKKSQPATKQTKQEKSGNVSTKPEKEPQSPPTDESSTEKQVNGEKKSESEPKGKSEPKGTQKKIPDMF